jgi:hypothetical protein
MTVLTAGNNGFGYSKLFFNYNNIRKLIQGIICHHQAPLHLPLVPGEDAWNWCGYTSNKILYRYENIKILLRIYNINKGKNVVPIENYYKWSFPSGVFCTLHQSYCPFVPDCYKKVVDNITTGSSVVLAGCSTPFGPVISEVFLEVAESLVDWLSHCTTI